MSTRQLSLAAHLRVIWIFGIAEMGPPNPAAIFKELKADSEKSAPFGGESEILNEAAPPSRLQILWRTSLEVGSAPRINSVY